MAQEFLNELQKYFDKFIDDKTKKRIESLAKKQSKEFSVDQFGFDANTLKVLAPVGIWFYRHYFRVETVGAHHIPKGRMMVIANHSGQLPFDGAMIISAFILEPKTPRLLRGMVERWCAEIPFISTLFARAGQVVGSPSICKTLLENDEAVIVFPEGVKGITKLYSERYKLGSFGTGFLRIAMSAKAPIIPVALIGAEEQAPAVANLAPLAKSLGLPALPIVFPQILPLPLPVKYRLYIGEPMYFDGDGTEDDEVLAGWVARIKDHMQSMIDEGLAKRKNIFF